MPVPDAGRNNGVRHRDFGSPRAEEIVVISIMNRVSFRSGVRVLGFLGLVVLARAAQPSVPVGNAENMMSSAAAPARTHFVRLESLDFKTLLSPVPPAGSVLAAADLEAVLQVQTWRTPEQVEWAKTIQEDNLFKHSKIIGTWFLLYD